MRINYLVYDLNMQFWNIGETVIIDVRRKEKTTKKSQLNELHAFRLEEMLAT